MHANHAEPARERERDLFRRSEKGRDGGRFIARGRSQSSHFVSVSRAGAITFYKPNAADHRSETADADDGQREKERATATTATATWRAKERRDLLRQPRFAPIGRRGRLLSRPALVDRGHLCVGVCRCVRVSRRARPAKMSAVSSSSSSSSASSSARRSTAANLENTTPPLPPSPRNANSQPASQIKRKQTLAAQYTPRIGCSIKTSLRALRLER